MKLTDENDNLQEHTEEDKKKKNISSKDIKSTNQDTSTSSKDPLYSFKESAKRNFWNILNQEIQTRDQNVSFANQNQTSFPSKITSPSTPASSPSSLSPPASPKSSTISLQSSLKTKTKSTQFLRIANSKIVKMNPPSTKSSFKVPNSFTIIKNNGLTKLCNLSQSIEAQKIVEETTPPLNEALLSNNSFKVTPGSPKIKDVDTQIFIHQPLFISSSSLFPLSEEHSKPIEPETLAKRDKSSTIYLTNSQTQLYRCYLCPYFNVHEDMIAKHWVHVHLGNRVYKCPHCSSDFLTNTQVLAHIQLAHPQKELRVLIAESKEFKKKIGFQYNPELFPLEIEVNLEDGSLQKGGGSIKINCHKCSLTFKSLHELEEHLKHPHFKFRPFSCSLCNFSKVSFASLYDLEHHIKTTHPNMYKNTNTNQVFLNKKDNPRNVLVIDWARGYTENIPQDFRCLLCTFVAKNSNSIFEHLIRSHKFTDTMACPMCRLPQDLGMLEVKKESYSCSSCNSFIQIVNKIHLRDKEFGTLYRCNKCTYKCCNKTLMSKHLKLNHTRFKAFICPYCYFSASAKGKVKSHIFASHPGKSWELILKHKAANLNVQQEQLFQAFVTKELINVTHDASKLFFECSGCYYADNDLAKVQNHLDEVHQLDKIKPNVRETWNLVIPFGEHYRCIMCGYRCSDRSCMARHAKYMHITSRPHACPYCHYNNVEKTKVRLHVMAHHPTLPKLVKTNTTLLEQMSYEAKKFYVKIDVEGNETGECLTTKSKFKSFSSNSVNFGNSGRSSLRTCYKKRQDPPSLNLNPLYRNNHTYNRLFNESLHSPEAEDVDINEEGVDIINDNIRGFIFRKKNKKDSNISSGSKNKNNCLQIIDMEDGKEKNKVKMESHHFNPTIIAPYSENMMSNNEEEEEEEMGPGRVKRVKIKKEVDNEEEYFNDSSQRNLNEEYEFINLNLPKNEKESFENKDEENEQEQNESLKMNNFFSNKTKVTIKKDPEEEGQEEEDMQKGEEEEEREEDDSINKFVELKVNIIPSNKKSHLGSKCIDNKVVNYINENNQSEDRKGQRYDLEEGETINLNFIDIKQDKDLSSLSINNNENDIKSDYNNNINDDIINNSITDSTININNFVDNMENENNKNMDNMNKKDNEDNNANNVDENNKNKSSEILNKNNKEMFDEMALNEEDNESLSQMIEEMEDEEDEKYINTKTCEKKNRKKLKKQRTKNNDKKKYIERKKQNKFEGLFVSSYVLEDPKLTLLTPLVRVGRVHIFV